VHKEAARPTNIPFHLISLPNFINSVFSISNSYGVLDFAESSEAEETKMSASFVEDDARLV
jgi:hypothetical protein